MRTITWQQTIESKAWAALQIRVAILCLLSMDTNIKESVCAAWAGVLAGTHRDSVRTREKMKERKKTGRQRDSEGSVGASPLPRGLISPGRFATRRSSGALARSCSRRRRSAVGAAQSVIAAPFVACGFLRPRRGGARKDRALPPYHRQSSRHDQSRGPISIHTITGTSPSCSSQ